MLDRRWGPKAFARGLIALGAALATLLVGGSADAQAQEAHVLIYSGTVAHRHVQAINEGIGPIQDALDDAGISHDWEDCGEVAGIPDCDDPDENDRIFTEQNLDQYDAILLFNAGGNEPEPLWDQDARDAIQGFVNDGGGIAATHLATDMGAGQTSWGWWDGPDNSALGTTMPAHPAAPQTATLQVSDRNHPSTRDLPEEIEHSDEHYSFDRSVRGTHHVLATLDETSYDPLAEPHGGGNPPAVAMGNDHPISWCRLYDGGRIWATSMGHFGNLYTANGGDNYLVNHIVGGVEWVAGVAGAEGDCGGTVWSNFRRTILSTEAQGPIGLDIADDGTVYWTEIGAQGMESEGRLVMWSPDSEQTSTVHVIPTRADALSTSEDGVLGMALDPDFEANRHVYIYYSPRGEGEGWPTTGTGMVLGYNRLSRFTLNAAGDAVVAEQPILDVPKVKVGPDGDGRTDISATNSNWPAHTGGAGLDFDSEGNLYLGVGDDANPYGLDQIWAPLDGRFEHRYDARNTSANTNDLRGKVLRIDPLEEIEPGAEPGIGETYAIPDGNMFEPGTPDTLPEIYAMGFRQPFSVQADPAEPGTIAVGEYGPDSGSSNPDRGPAGIIEWNHITEPGFFGWPFCTGDHSEENSYNRYEYPSGPSGERYDCSQETIPNESDFNTGFDDVPGPVDPAEVWHKRDGDYPEEFGIPPSGGQEANSGPIYRYDPDNPSQTKWPAYFDGSWLIFDRGNNWWREAKMTDDGEELLKVNAFFQPNQFGAPQHTSVIPAKFGPDGALYLARFTGRGSSSQVIRIDYVGEQEDEEAPTVAATVDGPENDDGDFVARASLEITASDGGGSGVERVEYSVDGGEWVEGENSDFAEPFVFTQQFDEPGDYDVAFRAFDRSGNESDEGQIEFTVVDGAGCTFLRSDEFDGADVDTGKWSVRIDEPGFDAEVVDGELVLPVLGEIDGTGTGPLALVSQQVPDGDDWTVTTRVTIDYETNWEQAGLMLWVSDGNFIKVVFTGDDANGDPAQRRFEITADDPEDTRHFATDSNVGADFPNTAWIRMFRDGNEIGGAFAPDEDGTPGQWTTLAGTRLVSGNDEGNEIDPPREGPGVVVGPYAGGNLDGPWNNTATFDFVRFEPDEIDCEPVDNDPPVIEQVAADPDSGDAPLEVDFSVLASDPDGDPLSYEWDFGDGGSSSQQDPTHTYDDPGTYEAEVTVSDGEAEVSDSVTVTVSDPEPPVGEPELGVEAPSQITVKAKKKQAKLPFRARNSGDAATGPVSLCVKAPKRKLKLKGKTCITRNIPAGQMRQRQVKLRVKPKARGKTTRVKLIARGPNVDTERTTVRVRIGR